MYYLCFDENKCLTYASAGRFVARFAATHPDRTLDTAVLLLGYSGECPIAQDGREYVLKKGNFQLLFPGVRHYGTGDASEGQSHFWCHFHLPEGYCIAEADSAEQLSDTGMCVVPEFAEIDDPEKYFILFSQLIDEAESENAGHAITDAYVKIIMCSLAASAAHEGRMGDHKLVSAIKDWTRRHALEGASACDLAKTLKYDPDYLTRIFKKHTGKTVSQYINGVRLQEAKNLLSNTDRSIAEIAYASGFADEKYFMRLFKRIESVTPTQYRTSHVKRHLN